MPDRDATLDAFTSGRASSESETDAETDSAQSTDPETDSAQSTDAETDRERPPDATSKTVAGDAEEVAGVDDEVAGDADQFESTYAWTPEGAVCASCGTETTRRWRTDAGFVCPACVDWERTPE